MRIMKAGLPHYAVGEIIRGFGRGSKQLGIPTANYPKEVVDALPKSIETGIYCGFAKVDTDVHKMVISIGWNPQFMNEQKSMETYIMHEFNGDLYGKILKIVILEYLRPEKKFNSLEELIKAINQDISEADKILDNEKFTKYKNDNFFTS